MYRDDITVSNLKESPNYRNELISLIESSYNYQNKNSFEIDFFPLMKISNAENNIILIKASTKELIGHIGVSNRDLCFNKNTYPVILIGGIVINSKFQKQGYFSLLMKKVLTKYNDNLFFLLWSDLNLLYKKFGFIEAGIQIKSGNKRFFPQENIKQTKLNLLSHQHQNQIRELYKNEYSQYFTFAREKKEWDDISQITSIDILYTVKNNSISSYLFKGKGEDLNDIVHESAGNLRQYNLNNNFIQWLPSNYKISKLDKISFLALFKVNNTKLLKKLIYQVSNQNININNIDHSNKTFTLSSRDKNYIMSECDLLNTLFTPRFHTELSKFLFMPTFFSGADSI